jgi:hypothetical protein
MMGQYEVGLGWKSRSVLHCYSHRLPLSAAASVPNRLDGFRVPIPRKSEPGPLAEILVILPQAILALANGFVIFDELDCADVFHHRESMLRFDTKSERCSKNGLCVRTAGYHDNPQCVMGTDRNAAIANILPYWVKDLSYGRYHSPQACDPCMCTDDQISQSAPSERRKIPLFRFAGPIAAGSLTFRSIGLARFLSAWSTMGCAESAPIT